MSTESGIPIKLDKERTLLLRFGDLKDVRRGLGGQTTTQIAMMVLGVDAEAISALLAVGLRHEDRALVKDPTKVDALIQTYLDNGGELYDLTTPILDSMKAARLIPKTFAEKRAEENGATERP